MRPLLLALLTLTASASAQTAAPSAACPCASTGPYPCAAVTLVALADQAGPLGLTDGQVADLQSLRDAYLRTVYETQGDIQAVQEALATLDRPFAPAEVFALFYDIGQHEAELDEAFHSGEAAMLRLLDETQRARWHALMVEAAGFQETPPECSADRPGGVPSP